MAEAKHTMSDLYQMQSLPLSAKVRMTEYRIRQWVDMYGEDGVYISFSGGKDSTVLLDIARNIYPNLKAVFVDTGLEYPEIREFVKTFDNVDWLRPKKNFKQVITEYGYPFISKEVSDRVDGARKYLEKLLDRQTDKQGNPNYTTLKTGDFPNVDKSQSGWWRYSMVIGEIKDNDRKPSQFNCMRYKYFLEAPFNISARCCSVMKKQPAHEYAKKTGRKPMTGQQASESRLRTSQWLQNGCNGFHMKSPISNPMSFWTEQDVLLYIKENNLPICSVYGEVVSADFDELEQIDGQINVSDLGIFDKERPLLKTTGCQRTGCMFCGYGCHLNKDQRFVMMKETHPKQYDYIMRPLEQGGLNYKEVIDWINENGKLTIRY